MADWIIANTRKGQSLNVVSINVSEDATVLGLLSRLQALGWDRGKAIIGDTVTDISIHDRGPATSDKYRIVDGRLRPPIGPVIRSIRLWDARNLFRQSLTALAQWLEMPRLEVYGDSEEDGWGSESCRQDVEILLAAFKRYWEFAAHHDIGSFARTAGAAAFNCFRHRFYHEAIYIHASDCATALERSGYFGGRCECFFLGKAAYGRYYQLDISSHYPSIMATEKLPSKLVHYAETVSVDWLASELERHEGIAKVEIDTPRPDYPVRINRQLCFPLGRFVTTLAGPELVDAMQVGAVVRVLAVALYETAILFDRYVHYWYGERRKYEKSDNPTLANFCKVQLNSLYGKFGQRAMNWEWIGDSLLDDTGYERMYKMEGSYYEQRRLWGKVEIAHYGLAARDALVAIPAFVTAYGRLQLRRLLRQAGQRHVYYCDTDAVIVDGAGWQALSPDIELNTLGGIRLARQGDELYISGPKAYTLGATSHIAGLPADATRLSEGSYQFERRPSMLGVLQAGKLDAYKTHLTRHIVRTQYHKGHSTASGWTEPFQLPADLDELGLRLG